MRDRARILEAIFVVMNESVRCCFGYEGTWPSPKNGWRRPPKIFDCQPIFSIQLVPETVRNTFELMTISIQQDKAWISKKKRFTISQKILRKIVLNIFDNNDEKKQHLAYLSLSYVK